MTKIKVGSDFSGVGAFEQALIRLGIEHETVFSCDMDKYARQTYTLNYGEPKYYPNNVYDREIPDESLDILMSSPPCQSFSLAGKRKGEDDKRGILFYNTHEFIQKNRPRYFIIENVKGLLSDDSGKTFQKWIDLLAGKSVNGNPVIFPNDDSTPYHVYYQVLNAKDYGIPQNRERIFIIGIRDDEDNDFCFPKPFPLQKRLKDVLESDVDEKYFLSDKMIKGLLREGSSREGQFQPHEENEISKCLTARYFKQSSSDPYIKIGAIRGRNPENPLSREAGLPTQQMLEINENGVSNSLTTVQKDNVVILGYTRDSKGVVTKRHEKQLSGTIHTSSGGGGNTDQFVLISSNTQKGFDLAEEEEDSINFSQPNSQTRRGRVGKKVSQTLETQCNQGIFTKQRIRRLTPKECFKLMDFNFGIPNVPDFKWEVSDSQAYRQAGNSICVGVLALLIKKLLKI